MRKNFFISIWFIYLSLIASIGLMRIAFMAGSVPAAEPSTKKAPTITIAVTKFIWKPAAPRLGSKVALSATPSTKEAKHTPEMPATSVSSTLSESTCTVISAGLAPMARLTPNSWVRSLTMIHMILPTPITPAISELSPTNSASRLMPKNRLSTISNISEISIKLTARSSSGCMGWFMPMARRMYGSLSEGEWPGSDVYMKASTAVPRLKARRMVLAGAMKLSSTRPIIEACESCPATPTT